MKKIMFNDKCGLTNAVVLGLKTMTRRMLPKHMRYDSEHCNKVFIRNNELVVDFGNGVEHTCDLPYKIGEEVAIAQKYKDYGIPEKNLRRLKLQVEKMQIVKYKK